MVFRIACLHGLKCRSEECREVLWIECYQIECWVDLFIQVFHAPAALRLVYWWAI